MLKLIFILIKYAVISLFALLMLLKPLSAYELLYDDDGYKIIKYETPREYFVCKDRELKEVKLWYKAEGLLFLILAGWGLSQTNSFGKTAGTIFLYYGFIKVFE